MRVFTTLVGLVGTVTAVAAAAAPQIQLQQHALTVGSRVDAASQHLSRFSPMELHSRVQDVHSVISDVLSAAHAHSMRPQATQQCNDAVTNAAQQMQSGKCGTAFSGGVPPSSGTGSPFSMINSMFEGLCSPGCNLLSLYTTIATACADDPQIAAGVQSVTSGPVSEFLSVGCIRDADGTLCLPKFFNALGAFSASFGAGGSASTPTGTGTGTPAANIFVGGYALTDAQMNGMCSSCAQRIATAVGAFTGTNQNTAQQLNFLCTRDPTDTTKFCVKQIGNLFGSTTNSNAFSDPTKLPPQLCEPCFRRLYNMAMETSGSTPSPTQTGSTSLQAQMNRFFDNLCMVDPITNKRCLTVMNTITAAADNSSSLSSFCPSPSPTTTTTAPATSTTGTALTTTRPTPVCPSGCQTKVQQIFGGAGCCLGTLLRTFGDGDADMQYMISLMGSCGVNTAVCTRPAPATVTIPLGGLRYDLYLANKARIDAALKSDFAAATGASTDSITIMVTKNGNGASCTFTVQLASSGDQTALSNTLNQQSQNGGVSFGQTTSAIKAIDPTAVQQPLVGSTDSSSQTGKASSSTPKASVLAVVLVAAAAVALALN